MRRLLGMFSSVINALDQSVDDANTGQTLNSALTLPTPTHHRRPGHCQKAEKLRIMRNHSIRSLVAAFVLTTAAGASAADPPARTVTQPRTGTTQPFGSGTTTRRSDGSSSSTRHFGSGSITTERDKSGKEITGHTQPFGLGTTTRRSDGSSSSTIRFGSGKITDEKPGRTTTSPTKRQ